MSSAHKKQRVFSYHNSHQEKGHLSNKQPTIMQSIPKNTSNKLKRTQRTISLQVSDAKEGMKQKVKVKKQQTVEKAVIQPSVQSKEQPNPHLLTVADLQSGKASNSPEYNKHLQLSPDFNSKQQTIKTEEAGVQANKARITLPYQLQKNLDETLQKLKSKQDSIDILNRTIQTRLVSAGQSKEGTSKRIDVYQVQINFYVDKISELQKELYEKNKIVTSLTQKNVEFNTVVKNNRKLIGQNHRLKQERELLERENAALKKLLIRKAQKSY